MKRILLSVCALLFLLSAPSATVKKELNNKSIQPELSLYAEGESDDFVYTEAYDGTYSGDLTLSINAFPDESMLNLEMSDVILEISKGTLVFPSIPILKVGDPVEVVFVDALFNPDGNIQAPEATNTDMGFPLKFSIIESSSSIDGNAITLTIRLVDGMGGAIADMDILFTGLKQGQSNDFVYTEAYDGTYSGDLTLAINAFPDESMLNLEMSDVILEISKGTLVFPSIPILKVGDPVEVVFADALFNQDGNIQAPEATNTDMGFPLKFSIIESSSSVDGDAITLTIRLVDGMGGAIADMDILFTGLKQDQSSNYTILEAEKKIIGYYNFSGQKLEREPESGLYIILYDNGTSKKVIRLRN